MARGADLGKLAAAIDAAQRDWRDVLLWAENPEQSKALWAISSQLSSEQREQLRALRKRDREQYVSCRLG